MVLLESVLADATTDSPKGDCRDRTVRTVWRKSQRIFRLAPRRPHFLLDEKNSLLEYCFQVIQRHHLRPRPLGGVEGRQTRDTRRTCKVLRVRAFEVGEVHQNLDNEKGGLSRPSKNASAFFSSSWFFKPVGGARGVSTKHIFHFFSRERIIRDCWQGFPFFHIHQTDRPTGNSSRHTSSFPFRKANAISSHALSRRPR